LDQQADYLPESPDSAASLRELKKRIREARDRGLCQLREGYSTPEQLGEWILEDFFNLLDSLYPLSAVPDVHEQETARHLSCAMKLRLGFVGREDLLRRLDECIAPPSHPVVLTGPSGVGKSAVLAEWAARWKAAHPADLVLEHFIGHTPESGNWQALVVRVLTEMQRAFTVGLQIPERPDLVGTALSDSVTVAPAQGGQDRRVVLVLDGLDRLSDEGPARQLTWLPDTRNTSFRIVASALPGECLDSTRRLGWLEMEVPPFESDDVAQATLTYFRTYSKTPPPGVVARLERSPAARNPLYLRSVLDELRQFGRHEGLTARTDHYLRATDLAGFYTTILGRWAEDFGAELVMAALRLLWAARDGLAEHEWLELLGTQGQPLARQAFTPFLLAVEPHLGQQLGLYSCDQASFRGAIEQAYLPTDEDKRVVHKQLADYFSRQPETIRKMHEHPWQLAKAAEWQRLYEILADLASASALWEMSRHDMRRYWFDLERHTDFRMRNAYTQIIREKAQSVRHSSPWLRHVISASAVAEILDDAGFHAEAIALRDLQILQDLEKEDLGHLQVELGNKANALLAKGNGQEALDLYEQQEEICRQILRQTIRRTRDKQTVYLYSQAEVQRSLVAALNNQSIICMDRREHERASIQLDEAEQICRQLRYWDGLQTCLANKARLAFGLGRTQAALVLQAQEERICRQQGLHEALAMCLDNQFRIYASMRQWGKALAAAEERSAMLARKGIALDTRSQQVLRDLRNRKARESDRVLSYASALLAEGMASSKKGNFTGTIWCCQTAREMLSSLQQTDNAAARGIQARERLYSGIAFAHLGHYAQAVHAFEAAVEIWQALETHQDVAEDLSAAQSNLQLARRQHAEAVARGVKPKPHAPPQDPRGILKKLLFRLIR